MTSKKHEQMCLRRMIHISFVTANANLYSKVMYTLHTIPEAVSLLDSVHLI